MARTLEGSLFDAHLHIIDPGYPLIENNGYLPAPFTVSDYRARMADFVLIGGAVVSGSFQGFDQGYLVDALHRLGPGFVGVTQLPYQVDDARLRELDRAGVRALRFNLRRGGSEGVARLREMALRVHDLCGWHVELYVDSRDLAELFPLLCDLPALVVDHLGLSQTGFPDLCRLVERGARVKASGFSRGDIEPLSAIRQLLAIDPGSVMFGTDLPSTRAPVPYRDSDLELIDRLEERALIEAVRFRNAQACYRLEAVTDVP